MRAKEIVRILKPDAAQIRHRKVVVELRCGHRVLTDEGVSSEYGRDMREPCPQCERRVSVGPFLMDRSVLDAAEARCNADYQVVPDVRTCPRWIIWALWGACAGVTIALMWGGPW